jgi:nuclear pore complex protein Nup210
LEDARVRIVVVASLHLDPHDAYVVPGTVLPLKLWQMKHGKKFEIKLPSSVYAFDVENSTVATYDSKKSEVTALEYGETAIKVTDKNCLDELEEQPEALTARIYVREPKYLSLTILPYKNWAIVLGQSYEIQVDVFDAKNQKIYVGEVSCL